MDSRTTARVHLLLGVVAVAGSVFVAGVPLGSGVDTWPATFGAGYVALGGAACWTSPRWDVRRGVTAALAASALSWGFRALTAWADDNLLDLASVLADATVSALFAVPVFLAFPIGIAMQRDSSRAVPALGAAAAVAFLVAYTLWGEGVRHVGDPLWAVFLLAAGVGILLASAPPLVLGSGVPTDE